MSYDITIGPDYFNYTWNLGPFFRDMIGGDGLRELNGLTGKQAFELLRKSFDQIERGLTRERPFSIKYDAPNGWGSTMGATVFLAKLMASCAAHPRHRVSAD